MGVRARLRAVCVVANPRNSQAIAVVCASQPIPNRIPHTFIRDHEHVLRRAIVLKAQFFRCRYKIVRGWRAQGQVLSRDGVNKLQSKRMQGLALQSALGSAAIHGIGHQRVVNMRSMDTNLVRAPRMQLAVQKGRVFAAIEHKKRGVRRLAMFAAL